MIFFWVKETSMIWSWCFFLLSFFYIQVVYRKKKQLVKNSVLELVKRCVGFHYAPCVSKTVVWTLNASCLDDTPTWIFNKHLRLNLPKVELLVTPHPANGSPFYLVAQEMFQELSSILCFLSPHASLSAFLLTLLLKCVPNSLTSPHHCCYLPVQSPSSLICTIALVF